jgi:hypothetical protein
MPPFWTDGSVSFVGTHPQIDSLRVLPNFHQQDYAPFSTALRQLELNR